MPIYNQGMPISNQGLSTSKQIINAIACVDESLIRNHYPECIVADKIKTKLLLQIPHMKAQALLTRAWMEIFKLPPTPAMGAAQ